MLDEHLSGTGAVYVKKTRELVGRFPYELHTTVAHLRHTDAWIEIDWKTAIPLQREAALLVLSLEDGRFVDFFITSVVVGGSVDVTVTGGIRSEW